MAPLDDKLGITGLPFKLTKTAMLETAFWGQNQSSYKRAETILKTKCGIPVNSETVRLTTNYVGNTVFKGDCHKANDANTQINNGNLEFTNDKPGVLYIELDGATLNTRTKDESGSI